MRLFLYPGQIEGKISQFLVNDIVRDVDNVVFKIPLHLIKVRNVREPESCRKHLYDFLVGLSVLLVHLGDEGRYLLINMIWNFNHELVSEVYGQDVSEAPLEDVHVDGHILTDLPMVHALPVELIQLLLHLLVNVHALILQLCECHAVK